MADKLQGTDIYTRKIIKANIYTMERQQIIVLGVNYMNASVTRVKEPITSSALVLRVIACFS